MHRHESRRSLAVGLALAAAACASPAADRPPALPPISPIMIPPAMAAAQADELTGRAWSWQRSTFSGKSDVVPDAPERYTLEFMPDGRARLRADCNRGSAPYQAGANRTLSLGPAAVTKMGCPPGSQDSEYLRELGSVAGYRLVDGGLVLTLGADGGAMRFAPIAR
jgi:heat shock protein HslJ